MARNFRITEDIIEKYGYTGGCPGCEAMNRGDEPKNHSENCREAYKQLLQQKDPEKYAKEMEKEDKKLARIVEEKQATPSQPAHKKRRPEQHKQRAARNDTVAATEEVERTEAAKEEVDRVAAAVREEEERVGRGSGGGERN